MFAQIMSLLKYLCAAILISSTFCYSELTSLNDFSTLVNKHIFPTTADSIKSPAKTMIWSPLSVYSALLPLLDAAGGKTEQELKNILFLTLNNDKNTSSSSPSPTPIRKSMSPLTPGLTIATGLFISDKYQLSQTFSQKLKLSRQNSKQGIVGTLETLPLDYSTNPKESVERVNNWVNQSTDGIINKIIQLDQFTKDTKLMLVNAVQFKGTWKSRFNPSSTETRVFHGNEGDSKVDMMLQRSTQDYGNFFDENNEPFEVLKLGYVDTEIKLVFVLPKNSGNLSQLFEALTLTDGKLSEIVERLEPTELDIYLPKFKVESQVPIKRALQEAGLTTLFSQMECNLTEMIERKESNTSSPTLLFLSDLIHKTVLDLDEDGTKAAAATVGFLVPLSGSMHHKIQNFTLDRPFILYIKSGQSNVFQGIVTDIPAAAIIDKTSLNVLNRSTNNAIPNSNITIANTNKTEVAKVVNVSPKMESNETDNKDAWWIHKGKPEYLDEDNNDSLRSSQPMNKNLQFAENSSSEGKSTSYYLSHKIAAYRFQQPEPTYPEGIRFPYPGINYNKIGPEIK